MKLQGVILLFFVICQIHSTVTLNNIQIFFNYTYDTNHDGKATLDEFTQYFQFMEPQLNITQQTIEDIFIYFDQNEDKFVTVHQIARLQKIIIGSNTFPQQIHIGLTNNSCQMQIMWVSMFYEYNDPRVYYSIYPTPLDYNFVTAKSITYNVGHVGFHGYIYKAVIKNLIPGKRYFYKVGDFHTGQYSAIKYFTGPPALNTTLKQITFAAVGDVGTYAPFGFKIIHQISKDNFMTPFNFIFFVGDIAYAGISSLQKGEVQPIWDLFGQMSEKFAAYTPFMPGTGNHEQYYNFTAYKTRYSLPRSYEGQTNLWFAFHYAQLCIIHLSSQHNYSQGSQQYQFLQQELIKASTNPNINWIMVGAHRAFYTSDKRQYGNPTLLAKSLQDLVNKYKVDIVHNGHHHNYQRMWPVYKGKVFKNGHNETHYNHPNTPIYIVQGTGGALNKQQEFQPVPEWSMKRMTRYGYGKVTIKGNVLKYQFLSAPGGNILDQWHIVK